MSLLTPILILLPLLLLALGAVVLVIELRRAEEGYEDDQGFHRAPKPARPARPSDPSSSSDRPEVDEFVKSSESIVF